MALRHRIQVEPRILCTDRICTCITLSDTESHGIINKSLLSSFTMNVKFAISAGLMFVLLCSNGVIVAASAYSLLVTRGGTLKPASLAVLLVIGVLIIGSAFIVKGERNQQSTTVSSTPVAGSNEAEATSNSSIITTSAKGSCGPGVRTMTVNNVEFCTADVSNDTRARPHATKTLAGHICRPL
jgi:hypothetical protein